MVTRISLLLLVSLYVVTSRTVPAHHTEVCYAKDLTPFVLFGSKTSYEEVRNLSGSPVSSHYGCTPVQFWFLSRHGTRYPGKKDITKMKLQLPELRESILNNHKPGKNGQLCRADLLNLKKWDPDLDLEDDSEITSEGKKELIAIAKRLKGRYPSLLATKYKKMQYEFRVTTKKRTKQSAKAFAKGLWHKDVDIPEAIVNDPLLHFYDACDAYEKMTSDPEAMKEVKLFTETDVMQAVVANVSKTLGFQTNLTFDTVLLMYDMCRYDKAWDLDSVSPWCAPFTDNDLLVMEYGEDLKNYYESGYGHDINVKLGCPPIKDMVKRFRNIDKDSPLGVFYFSHSTLLQFVISRLGMAKDSEVLKHDNYEALRDRKWRISYIGPFSTNIAAVYYDCEDEPKVEFLFQERPILIEGCTDTLCPWRIVQSQLAEIADTCDLERICK